MMEMEKTLERGAGVLLSISSLPSKYGIGTLGKIAYDFVDKIEKTRLKYWQVLPVGPTTYGDSPYQSFSAFAGNPYFIDLEILCEEGLLDKNELDQIKWSYVEDEVSYELLWDNRFNILKKAYQKSEHKNTDEYISFCERTAYWLDDYALFMSCKEHFNNVAWFDWDEDIKFRKDDAVKMYTEKLIESIDYYKFIQFKFYEQWKKLKDYANQKGIKIVGDIPIYVALDSVDIWANPDLFQLDEDLEPKYVAGCPPDMFSADGQKWGNPLYDWDTMEQQDFAWWKKRMNFSATIYDIVRIDHFIGIQRYFSIPTKGLPKDGFYTEGPNEKLIEAIDSVTGESKIIAEDLGVLTDEVKALLKKSGYPGMRVLEFAFDSGNQNLYLPHNHIKNSVLYIGTHDNDTLMGYLKDLSEGAKWYLKEYLCCGEHDSDEDIADRMIRVAMSSVCDTTILQMQDILKKDSKARMNFPSTMGTNWQWRMLENEFTEEHCEKIKKLVEIYAR